MKRLILVFMLLFAGLVMGQTIIPSNGAPAGSCSTTVITNDYTTGNLWGCKQSTGTSQWVNNAASSGGAPTTSKYILQSADVSLPNAQALSALSTGLLKVTTTTGVLTNAASADIVGLFSTCSGTQYLGADGACHTAAGTPGGSNTQLQYNNSSSFGGTAAWTYASGTGVLIGAQVADGNDLLFMNRYTDSGSPSGNLIHVQNAAKNVDLFSLKASGNIVMTAGGSWTSTDTGSPGFVLSTNLETAQQPLAAPSFSASGSNGGIDLTEGTGGSLTAASSHDIIWADSTAHRPKMNNNNGTATSIAGLSDAVTAFTGTIASNSVVMNATASSAAPTAISVPACADSGGNHLNYTTGSFTCGTSGSGGSAGTAWTSSSMGGYNSGQLAATSGKMSCSGIIIPPGGISTGHVVVGVQTLDGSNNSDFCIYNSSGTLVANIGASHVAQNTSTAWSQGTVTIPAGKNYACFTSAASTFSVSLQTSMYTFYTAANTTQNNGGSGACAASITPPSDSWSVSNAVLLFALQ